MAGLRTVRRSYADPRVQKSMFRILRENVLCSISTVAPGNRAHINTAYFCYSPDLELYFLSEVDSVHCRNLERNASMAMTIFRSAQVWGLPSRGIQLFGRAHPAKGVHAETAERLYGRRFPAYLRYTRSTRAKDRGMGAQLRSYRFYRFVPRTVKILDEAEFGGGVFGVATVTRRKISR
jgi:uncharacterized protein YhbP (UPF0306 family)